MTPFLLKVDRVASVEEVRVLAELGVREMTFEPKVLTDGLEDHRNVTTEEARQMMAAAPGVRWGVSIPGGWGKPIPLKTVLLPSIGFVQSLSLAHAKDISAVPGLEFILFSIFIDGDDETMDRAKKTLSDARQAGAKRCIVDVYSHLKDGWAKAVQPENSHDAPKEDKVSTPEAQLRNFIRSIVVSDWALSYDEVKESDLRSLASQHRILIESDFRPEHLRALQNGPYVGVNLTLAAWQQSFGDVVALLTAFQQQSDT